MSNTTQLRELPLPYRISSESYFAAIRPMGWPIWLDSGRPQQTRGRYDILSAAPYKKLYSDKQGNHCQTDTGICHYEDPWQALSCELGNTVTTRSNLPFTGGAMGYFGYDLGRQLEQLKDSIDDDTPLPLMQIGLYDWAIIQDHLQKTCTLVARNSLPQEALEKLFDKLQETPKETKKTFNIKELKTNTSLNNYLKKVSKIQNYIQAGDCYQVNFAQRFEGHYEGDPFCAYLELRRQLPSPFSCYFETETSAILSLSPERLLLSDGRQVTSQPIKGTAPRGRTPKEDWHLSQELCNSGKNQAENLMIVDLLRNDISKVCNPHTVKAPKLFDLESYANVHHLVSTVTGELREGVSAVELLKACFPGGSITGAPKVRAMEIIEELENSRRSVYCGSLGYIDHNGRMDTNIAIRTLVTNGEKIFCWGGGGIVADSTPADEYQESMTKVGLILDTLVKM